MEDQNGSRTSTKLPIPPPATAKSAGNITPDDYEPFFKAIKAVSTGGATRIKVRPVNRVGMGKGPREEGGMLVTIEEREGDKPLFALLRPLNSGYATVFRVVIAERFRFVESTIEEGASCPKKPVPSATVSSASAAVTGSAPESPTTPSSSGSTGSSSRTPDTDTKNAATTGSTFAPNRLKSSASAQPSAHVPSPNKEVAFSLSGSTTPPPSSHSSDALKASATKSSPLLAPEAPSETSSASKATQTSTSNHSPVPTSATPVPKITPSDIPTFDLFKQAEFFREWLQQFQAYEDLIGISCIPAGSRKTCLRQSLLRYSLSQATLKKLNSLSEWRRNEEQDPDKMVESLGNLVKGKMEEVLISLNSYTEGPSKKRVKIEAVYDNDDRLRSDAEERE